MDTFENVGRRGMETDENACVVCGRKVRIGTIECRCRKKLCQRHVRYDAHACSFDYKCMGREIVERQNPRVNAAKI